MNELDLKNDFFAAVNAKWLKEAKIPADKPGTGSFVEIDLELEKILREETNAWLKDPQKAPQDKKIQEFIKYYAMLLDIKKRDQLGFKPFEKYLAKLNKLRSFDDVDEHYSELILGKQFLPFSLFVSNDFVDSEKQVLYLSGASLLLPEKSYYEDQETKEKYYQLFQEKTLKLLKLCNFSAKEAQKMITDALSFDEKLVDLNKSATEAADYVKSYNPMDLTKVDAQLGPFELARITKELTEQDVKTIVVTYPLFIEKFNSVFTEENFHAFKQLMIIYAIYDASKFLSEKIRLASTEFWNQLYGVKQASSAKKHAFLLSKSTFSMPIGVQYANDHFGQEAKKDVEDMVASMIKIYQDRLEKNSWLSEATKQKAILKLSKLTPLIGYPIEMRPFYDKFIVDTSKDQTLLDHSFVFARFRNEYDFSRYMKPVNRNYWGMSPATVNAYFHPSKNQIVFPAAILQAPFYDKKANSSTNFGGIGAVIAHEISHAFDNNGSQFDEKGNLNLWWTEEDQKNFKVKTQQMINLFEGQETEFGKTKGQLTVSENIADSGGVACAFSAAKLRDDFDPKALFINHATIWRSKYNPEYAKMLLESDVHAPTKLRANLQLSNFQPFLDAFNIKEGDKMFIAKEDQVKIW